MTTRIDGERLRSRRIELGLSPVRLGRLVGRSGKCIRRLEQGMSAEGVTLGELNTIAEALGSEPAWFLVDADVPQRPIAQSLTARLGALLASEPDGVDMSALCVLCGVTADELAQALDEFAGLLGGVGQSLVMEGTRARVVPAPLEPSDRHELALASRSGHVLRSNEAKLLLAIARGEITREPDRFSATGRTLGRLETIGAVEFPDADERAGRRPALSADVVYSLLLELNSPRA